MTHLQPSKAPQPKASRSAVVSSENRAVNAPPTRARVSSMADAREKRLGQRLNRYAEPAGESTTLPPLVQNPVVDSQTHSPENMFEISQKVNILGMDFDNLTPQEFLSALRKGVVFTPNVDHMMKLRNDPEFAAVYKRADFKICDSQILMYASRFLGTPLKAKISGSDLFPWFCDHHRTNENIRIFLLGGQAGVAKQARDRINARIGREIVVGEYSPPYGFEQSAAECSQIVSRIEQSSATVVAVCLGAPKQEKWIAANCDRLPNVDIFMAVGAVVDFEAGAKPRAPRFVSDLGLEWLYRLVCEPRRLWRRYLLEDMPFLGLVLAEKLKRMSSSR